jgi:hypothetical protein
MALGVHQSYRLRGLQTYHYLAIYIYTYIYGIPHTDICLINYVTTSPGSKMTIWPPGEWIVPRGVLETTKNRDSCRPKLGLYVAKWWFKPLILWSCLIYSSKPFYWVGYLDKAQLSARTCLQNGLEQLSWWHDHMGFLKKPGRTPKYLFEWEPDFLQVPISMHTIWGF